MIYKNKEKLGRFYEQFAGSDQVLILINADPDAIASAMAVSRLLWRKVMSVTISHINTINRPDNLAMIRLLGMARRALLAEGLIRPGQLELYIMNLEERKPIQLTDNGAANFGPYWHPDGKRIIFSSNLHNPDGRNFDLFLIDIDSRDIERITHYDGFDGFPMFSHDGKKLVFASNRRGKVRGETNVFIADWVDDKPE